MSNHRATRRSPPAKKAKIDDDLKDVAETAWEHYRSYLESCGMNGEDNEGDIDEVEELLNIVLKPHFPKIMPLKSPLKHKERIGGCSITSLLPVLISVAYYHLADCAISDCLELQQQSKRSNNVNEEMQETIQKCQVLMEESLHWYPGNAAMWSMGANFGRVFQLISTTTVCQWYERAVESAVQVRKIGMDLLEEDKISPQMKEWTEILLLNHVAGIEYVVDDDDDDEEEDNEADRGRDVKEEKDEKKQEKSCVDKENGADTECSDGEEEEGYFSSSAVESTSRFMAAMLHSTAGRHEIALEHLRRFSLTHRLHPHVWQLVNAPLGPQKGPNHPIKYQGKTGSTGILPAGIYKRLCQVFAPEATYWSESNYDNRGYYSYYMDMPLAVKENVENYRAENLIEDVIWNYLYPLIQERLDSSHDIDEKEKIIRGAEWWVHTRPIKASLGHNLHFDTDEALLKQEGIITHPVYSSVLYLTGGAPDNGGGGATVVLEQTPESQNVATKVWNCVPQDNSLLIFRGNMLHGVLPCPGHDNCQHIGHNEYKQKFASCREADASEVIRNQWMLKTSETYKGSNGRHRLTFLVGFWTRRVPDKMKNRKLYGPCGPFPPRPSTTSRENQYAWVDEICKGYDGAIKPSIISQNHRSDLLLCHLPVTTPAWEPLEDLDESENGATKLEIPKAIDHRFFVRGAPKCFRDSLFAGSDDDNEGTDEEEDERENK